VELEHLTCQCGSFEHTVRLSLDAGDGRLWLEFCTDRFDPWWKRVLTALKHVFGRARSSRYDAVLIRANDYDKLRDMLRKSEIAKAGAQSRAREQLLKGW